MNQDHSPERNSNTEVSPGDESSAANHRFSVADGRVGPDPDDISPTVNMREARERYGLSVYAIYRAVKEKRLRAVQPGGKGRIYYLEDEVRTLAERLGKCPYTWAGAA